MEQRIEVDFNVHHVKCRECGEPMVLIAEFSVTACMWSVKFGCKSCCAMYGPYFCSRTDRGEGHELVSSVCYAMRIMKEACDE